MPTNFGWTINHNLSEKQIGFLRCMFLKRKRLLSYSRNSNQRIKKKKMMILLSSNQKDELSNF